MYMQQKQIRDENDRKRRDIYKDRGGAGVPRAF